MALDETKPLIAAAFVCETVLEEGLPGGQIYSAIRIVDQYKLSIVPVGVLAKPGQTPTQPAPPVTPVVNPSQVIDMSAFVMLRAGSVTGKHEISVVVRGPDGTSRPFPAKMPVEFKIGDPAEAAVLNIKLILPSDSPRGRYWIDVLWDEEVLTKIPVSVQTAESQEIAPGQPG